MEIIKLNNFRLFDKTIDIFLDKNNSFNNLIEFHLINELYESDKNNLSKILKILNNYRKLNIVKIVDKSMDDNLIETFIKNNQLNL